jgi:hypothetical protein
MTQQVRASIAIAFVVCLLISAGIFIMRKATDKENPQTVTVTAEPGSTVTVHTTQVIPASPESKYGIYVEQNIQEKETTFGFSYKF